MLQKSILRKNPKETKKKKSIFCFLSAKGIFFLIIFISSGKQKRFELTEIV